MIEIQSDTGAWYQRWGVRALSLGGQVMRAGMVERWRGGQGWSLGVGVMRELEGAGRGRKTGIWRYISIHHCSTAFHMSYFYNGD